MNSTQLLAPINIAAIVLSLLSACASVPQGATASNQAVSTGIERLKAQHKSTIRAFAESARASVFKVWDLDILDRVVQDELNQNCNGENCPETLTADQAATAAATAADIREELINQINKNEAKLLAQAEMNYNSVKSINNTVTGYLESLEKQRAAMDNLRDLAALGIAGISNSDTLTFIKEILEIAKNPEAALPSGTSDHGRISCLK